jgi:hypothetical protein
MYMNKAIIIIIVDANELEIVAEGGLEPIIQVYMCTCSYNLICVFIYVSACSLMCIFIYLCMNPLS